MLADIYLGTALAIFLAIFGWSESIFGLSQRTKEKEAEFIRRARLTLQSYLQLRTLVFSSTAQEQGAYTKKLLNIIKNTQIKSGDKHIFDKLRDNETILKKLDKYNVAKKVLVLILFLYLYVGGTAILILENSTEQLSTLSPSIIWLQAILFILICIGIFIYTKTSSNERIIQANLNSLILQINGGD